MSNFGGDEPSFPSRNYTLTIAVKKHAKLDNKFLKSFEVNFTGFLCFVPNILSRIVDNPFKLRNIFRTKTLSYYCDTKDKVSEYLKSHTVYKFCSPACNNKLNIRECK